MSFGETQSKLVPLENMFSRFRSKSEENLNESMENDENQLGNRWENEENRRETNENQRGSDEIQGKPSENVTTTRQSATKTHMLCSPGLRPAKRHTKAHSQTCKKKPSQLAKT